MCRVQFRRYGLNTFPNTRCELDAGTRRVFSGRLIIPVNWISLPFPNVYARAGRFLRQFTERVDLNTRAYFAYLYTARWLGFRFHMVVTIVLIASCFFSVAVHEYSGALGEHFNMYW